MAPQPGCVTCRRLCALLLSVLLGGSAAAQATNTIGVDSTVALTVIVRRDTAPVADVAVGSGSIRGSTDAGGMAVLQLAPGDRRIIAAKIGFKPETLLVRLRAGVDTSVTIELLAQPTELSGVIVSATRSGRRIEDEPLRVETLSEEEVEEKLLMTPGDITMMLNESAGLRVQTTSPSLGGAAVRVQGLRGRYTQILADGLPLYGGQTGGLGLLQIPPMDLGGVEIIKGVASALYGGSALGGVINLISRRPEEEPVRKLLLNQTTLRGTDVVGFASQQLTNRWGYTLLTGGHRQSQVDRDRDSWADLPGYERGIVRPRAFWSGSAGHSLMLTLGTTLERREGGTIGDATVPSGSTYPENLRTNRYDGGVVAGFLVGSNAILSMRGAAAMQRHRHTFGDVSERDRHLTWLGETSMTIPSGASLWVIGAAVQQERYEADDVTGFDYRFTTPSLFAQNTVTLSSSLSLTASARLDRHSEYGTQLAPRLSALARFGPTWTLRLSGGGGYFAPSPFTEETEVIGLSPLAPMRDIREERARSGSIDLGGVMRAVEVNVTVFGSVVDAPVGLRAAAGSAERVELVNVDDPTRTAGAELLMRWNPVPFHVTGSYTFVRSTEQDPESGLRRNAPLTPRHQSGIVAMWEKEEEARIGVEVYYTGAQSLDDNPYRDESKPYVHVGILAERRFGQARVFVNAENLLGYRQTRYDPLVLPARGLGGRWTTDVWGPLEGRVANIGVRLDAK
jgi:outer membrane receptor for ferrienterochelin and colicins